MLLIWRGFSINFVAIIGITEKVEAIKGQKVHQILVKVERPIIEEGDNNWYDLLTVQLDSNTFVKELKSISLDNIVEINGRIKYLKNNSLIVDERLQVF